MVPSRHRVDGMSRRYRRLQDWERAAIEAAYASGEKLISLAAEFDCDQSTVSRIAERSGQPRRRAGRRVGPPKRPKDLSPKTVRRLDYKRRMALVQCRMAERASQA